MSEAIRDLPPVLRSAGVWELLTPKRLTALSRIRQERSGASLKLLLLGLVGFGFWSAIFGVAYRVLRYARSVEEIGGFLPGKMLGLVLLAFTAILLLSNLITALSIFFLAKDLDMLLAAPVDWLRLYLAKLGETIVHSSWMVALLAIPIFAAYGIVYDGGPLFPIVAAAAFVPFLIVPGVIGSALTLALVNIFPARRSRDLLSIIAIGGAGVLIVLLRVIRPEQLARPEGFRSLLDFIVLLRAPTHPFLPSEWAADMVMNWLHRIADPLPVLLLWTTAGAFVVMGAALHARHYRSGFSKAQVAAQRVVRRPIRGAASRLLARMPVSRREFVLKDMRLFFRDSTQWSQLILLAVLVVVYVFNIRMLPLFSGERVPVMLVTAIAFLNQGLAGFVLAAIAARFIFPAVSLEGRQMWLLRSSPLDLRSMLWSKYWIGTTPLLVLAVAITGTTNYLLQASLFMMAMSLGTIVLFTLAASALALGLGALYPQFDTENAAQIPTSFGGLVYMMSSILLLAVIIAIEARPVITYLRVAREGEAVGLTLEMALSAAAVVALCLAATMIPLRLGLRRLERDDSDR